MITGCCWPTIELVEPCKITTNKTLIGIKEIRSAMYITLCHQLVRVHSFMLLHANGTN